MAHSTFNLEDAVLLIAAAEAAYHNESEINAKIEPYGLKLYHFIDNTETDTQGYIARDDTRMVLAFRGTEPQNLRDWFTDAQMLLKHYPKVGKWFKKPKVHSGFLGAFNSIQEEIRTKIMALMDENPAYSLLITGHSLGASLATLAALDLNETLRMNITLYTYGGPRVGNRWFVRYFNNKIQESFRVINDGDIVPDFPPNIFGYRHVGTEVFIDNDKGIIIDPSHDKPFYEGLEDWFGLITGEAGKHHHEDSYLNNLIKILETTEESNT